MHSCICFYGLHKSLLTRLYLGVIRHYLPGVFKHVILFYNVKDFYFNGSKYVKLIFDSFVCIYLSVILSKLIYFFPESCKNAKCSYHPLDKFLCQSCPKFILHSP